MSTYVSYKFQKRKKKAKFSILFSNDTSACNMAMATLESHGAIKPFFDVLSSTDVNRWVIINVI